MLPFLDQDGHEDLDGKLYALWERLPGPEGYEALAAAAREIIEGVEGRLVRPGWEGAWREHGGVLWGWFLDPDRDRGEPDLLHAAFTEMVRFVLDTKNPRQEKEHAGRLRKALYDYLHLRGFPVAKHPDGPEGGRWFWWDGKRYPIPRGRQYDILDFMWGHRDRDSARFTQLFDDAFDGEEMSASAVKAAVCRLNAALRGIPGFGRKLATNCVDRLIFWEER